MSERNEEIRKELLRAAPSLEGLPKDPGMKVPKGYFESLPDRVIDKAAREEKLDRKSSGGNSTRIIHMRRYLYAAASVAAILVAAVFLFRQGEQQDALSGISDEDAYTYVMQNIDAYSTADMALLISSEEMLEELIEPDVNSTNEIIDLMLDDVDDDLLRELF